VRASARALRERFVALLHLDDPPWRVALALAVGVFISFTPFLGFQTLLALLVAALARLNAAVVVTGTWLNLPWFMPFVYAGALLLAQLHDGRYRLHRYELGSGTLTPIEHPEGQIEWARGYGVVRAGEFTAVKPDTLFQAASISKTVAAMTSMPSSRSIVDSPSVDICRRFSGRRLPLQSPTAC